MRLSFTTFAPLSMFDATRGACKTTPARCEATRELRFLGLFFESPWRVGDG